MTGRTLRSFAALALLSGFAHAGQEPGVLRRHFVPDSVESYRLTGDLNTLITLPNGMGEETVTANTIARYDVKTKSVQGDKAEVESTMTLEKMETTGPFSPDTKELPKPVVTKGTVDPLNRLRIATEAAKADQDMLTSVLGGEDSQAIAGAFLELPDHPVKDGDTWRVTVPKNGVMKEDQYLTATRVDQEDLDGTQVWKVNLTGTLVTAIDSVTLPDSAGPMAGQKMGLKGSIDVTGTAYIDAKTGQTRRMSTEFKGKQTLTLLELGLSVETSSTLKSASELLKS